nr:polycystin-1-like isoform X2 [Paramormyrops kingsleyae]
MMLFPGLWFSHAGQVLSVEMVVQPSERHTYAKVQIFRPYCSPSQHLVPPGCASLHNPFSCCFQEPLCNTTGGCAIGQHWCHLLDSCMPVTSPCSPYYSASQGRGFSMPPRLSATTPFYHQVADFPLDLSPSSELVHVNVMLPEREINVYPDDILAVQHTAPPGGFLHCLRSSSSPWRQSYVSLAGPEWGGWIAGGLLAMPPGAQWVDEVVCDLRLLYADAFSGYTTSTMHSTGQSPIHMETTGSLGNDRIYGGVGPTLTPVLGIHLVYPTPDQGGQIHIPVNTPTLFIIKIQSGSNATSSWSAPISQTGIPFLPSCPPGPTESHHVCEKDSADTWFSHAYLALSEPGSHMLNVSASNRISSQSVSVRLQAHQRVRGLTILPHGDQRLLVGAPQVFNATVESGSAVKYTWVIDDLMQFAYEGQTYSVVFKKPAQYKLTVVAENPVSSQSVEVMLTVENVFLMTHPTFFSIREVIPVSTFQFFTFRVKVDTCLGAAFWWDFGDNSPAVNHSYPSSSEPRGTQLEPGVRQTYLQDTISHSYQQPGDYKLNVKVFNQYERIEKAVLVKVRSPLAKLVISATPSVPLVNQTFHLEALPWPSSYGILYTWNFGSSTHEVKGVESKISHILRAAGMYNVTVKANNSLSELTTWLALEIVENISGIQLSSSAPDEFGSISVIEGSVSSGTSLLWTFDMGDGSLLENISNNSMAYTYRLPGNYTVRVTVRNAVSQASKTISIEVYKLNINGILPTGCSESGHLTYFTTLVTGNAAKLMFYWNFGDGTPVSVIQGISTASHIYELPGNYEANVTAFSSVGSTFYSKNICMEEFIAAITVNSSKDAVAVNEEVCFSAFVQPKLDELHSYQFLWNSSCCNDYVQGHANHCFIFKKDGHYQVSVEARNNVSRKTAKAFVAVIKPIVNATVKTSGHCGTMVINKSYLFWVETFPRTDFSVLWDMGDETPKKQGQNISHTFKLEGGFKITATAINGVSQHSANIEVMVMIPLSNLMLQIKKAIVEVGEEVVITAVTNVIKHVTFNWSIDASVPVVTGTPSFAYVFPRVGLYRIYVTAENNVSKQEAAVSIEVLKRIQGVQITSTSLISMKYLPTQENVILSATVTGGSNLTYFWMVLVNGKNRSTQNGEHFQLVTEAPGDVFVEVTVSNRLGKVKSSVLLRAEERVSGVQISTTRDIVALGKPVEISVSVRKGTNLQFFWYVGSSISPLSSAGPSLLQVFSTLGPIVVKASVSNMIGYSEATKLLIVQEEIQNVIFKINDKMNPFFVSSNSELLFFASVEKGNYLTWEWECFSENKGPTRFGSTQSVLHSFSVAGAYHVLLNVSNNISWQTVTHKVNVQDAIQGLNLKVSSHIVCTDDPIVFIPTILTGSDVHVYMDIDNGNVSVSLIEKHFAVSSLPVGNHTITARAQNNVSSSVVTANVQVVEKILGLRLVNCCHSVLESLKEISFEAEVLNRMPMIYSWNFSLAGFQPSWAIGPKVVYTPIGHGTLTVNVVASNGFCSQSLSEWVSIEWPVQYARIVYKAATIFVSQVVVFSAITNNGSSLRFKWEFGDSDEATIITDSNIVSHTYYFPGRYVVQLTVLNNISQVVTQLPIEARNLECALPRVSLIQKQSIILRSRPSYFEANVDLQGCVAYKTSYLWEAFFAPLCQEEDIVPLSATVDMTMPLLKLPKHALAVGTYCLRFTAVLQGTSLQQQQSIKVTVVHSPLIPLIKGGSHRIWSSNRDLLLDGTESRDPDYETEDGNPLQYQWDCIVQTPAVSPCHTNITQSNSSTVLVSHKMLHPERVYLFILTVYKQGRPSVSTSQSVVVEVGHMLSVSVACVSCSSTSSFRSSYNRPIVLSSSCSSCDGSLQLLYQWSAESWNGDLLDLNEVTTSTGIASPDLVIRSGVLLDGPNYTFTLNVSQPSLNLWGSASLILLPNLPPRGGVCKLSPDTSVRLLETLVTYKCSGWVDGDDEATQLIYSLKVEICQHYGQPCLFHTLYRGTRNTYGSFVPLGFSDPGEKKMSVINVLVLVEDDLGSVITALNRTLVVLEPKGDQRTTEWLRNKCQSELWALFQNGNPQEVIPYTIALTSQLNQIENVSEQEHQDRVMIRGNMTRMLASLPVSSLQDAVQIGSALAQCTADPRDLVCEGCKEKVLEATGKMITTLGEETKAGDITPLEAGRSILHVLGSAIAADAGSSATSAHPNASMSLAASDTAVFAFGQVGDLMQSLMRSRMRGEEPLTLAAPRISAVGQRSDPADLLCTEPSSSCSFHIPRGLGSQLRVEREEVVQIVMDLDGGGPLVSAAEPPISTKLAAMEFTTLQGRSIVIQDLQPDRAIRVMLQNHLPAGCQGHMREQKGSVGDLPLPPKGSVRFLVKPPSMDPKAGLFITFNFSLLSGTGEQSSGQVTITVDNQSIHSISQHVRNLSISLSAADPALEETIFLSPLQNGSGQELFVSMSSSVNGATMQASVCVFSSLCQYFSTEQRRWSSEGLRPLGGSSPRVAHCLTQHLTVFGASMFVHPEAVILLPPPERPVRNVVVGIVCGVLLLLHMLVGLIAHKLDHLDSTRLSSVPLCGQPGRYQYRVLVKTGWDRGSGTTAHVGISLYGLNKSGSRHLQREGAFQRNALDDFQLETEANLGEIWKIRIWHDNTGLDPSWYLQHVIVWDRQTDNMFFFLVEDWLSVENEKNGGLVEKEVLASCPQELQRFWRILRAQLMHGMMERHIWASVWERPAHSNFTRAQRVTCCALLLHLYLAAAAVWYGAAGSSETRTPVSDHVPVNAETLAMGMTVAVFVFPLQLLFCFLFRNTCSKVTLEETAPPTPASQTVEMDVYLDQSNITGSSFLSLPRGLDSITYGGSDGEFLGSKKIESDFWNASKLSNEITEEQWASSCSMSDLPELLEEPVLSPARLLKRKKAQLQLQLGSPAGSMQQTASPSLTSEALPTTLSEQDLIKSLSADSKLSSSSSGRVTTDCSPSTACKTVLSDTQDSFCSGWSQTSRTNDSLGVGLYRSASSLSVFSTASTFLPSPSPDSLDTSSATRIGVARSAPCWCLPSWMLKVIYLLIGLVLGLSLAVVGLYGSSFSESVLLMWLISASSAFLTSVLLLEPLKVFVQALFMAIVVRPVDPEVEERLAQEAIVQKVCVAQGGRVRPPCGYGLLHAKEEARKVRVLRSLMKSCVVHVLFLLVVLLVNYQSSVHDAQVRLLHSAVKHWIVAAPPGSPKLSKLAGWTEVWQWMDRSLTAYIHENPSLSLVGLPRLQRVQVPGICCTMVRSYGEQNLTSHIPSMDLRTSANNSSSEHFFSWLWPRWRSDMGRRGEESVDLGSSTGDTRQLLSDLQGGSFINSATQSMSVKFTQHHRETSLFVSVTVMIQWAQTETTFISIQPFHMPASSLGPDLHIATTVLLLLFALSFLGSELWAMVKEKSRYFRDFRHCLQLLVSLLSLGSAALRLSFLHVAASRLSHLRKQPRTFVSLHDAAQLAQLSCQLSALLLTLLVLKTVGPLRFVRRWVVFSKALQQAGRELCGAAFLYALLLLLFTHVGCMLFSHSVEGFRTTGQAILTLVSALRGRAVVRRLCQQHPVLGTLYCLALLGTGLWALGRFCGILLLRSYRIVQTELYRPTFEPQDYEMVEFFIKRLKLWIGLSKSKEFRHKVKFEGMVSPPSRSSQGSQFSGLEVHSPTRSCLPSALSQVSEDSIISESYDVQCYLDRLLPAANSLLRQFEQVNQVTDDLHAIEQMLLRNWTRISLKRQQRDNQRRSQGRGSASPPIPQAVLQPPSLLHSPHPPPSTAPALTSCHTPSAFSSSTQPCQTLQACSVPNAVPANDNILIRRVSGTDSGFRPLPGRRAWHSGTAHSADIGQRPPQAPNSLQARPKSEEGKRRFVFDQVPVKRRAWQPEGPEMWTCETYWKNLHDNS